MSTSHDNNVRLSLTETLITDGLGYCCLWGFFKIYRQTGLIALRLGVTPRTIRLYKARFRSGEFECKCCDNCLKKVISKRG
jgi:hypothetical protein